MPLGSSYPLTPAGKAQNVWLAAGGIGAAPLIFAARHMAALGMEKFKMRSFVGFRDEDSVFAKGEFEACGKLCLSIGGLVTDKISEALADEKPDMILACGPTPMLASLREICAASGAVVYASLEERMGCGVGACLACALSVKNSEGADYKRVCRDGPVFDLAEVDFK
jgi:dihydroorotate dehydrogenase electron transfer subunit